MNLEAQSRTLFSAFMENGCALSPYWEGCETVPHPFYGSQ